MDEQLKALFEYTKFHIGIYITLIAAIIGIFANDSLKALYSSYVPFMLITLICFVIAGAAAGCVAAGIPYSKTFDGFMSSNVGPWREEWINARICTHLEHAAFWIGIAVALIGIGWVTLFVDPTLEITPVDCLDPLAQLQVRDFDAPSIRRYS